METFVKLDIINIYTRIENETEICALSLYMNFYDEEWNLHRMLYRLVLILDIHQPSVCIATTANTLSLFSHSSSLFLILMSHPPRFSLSSFRLLKPKASSRTSSSRKPRSRALEDFYASQRNKGVAKLPGPIDIRKRPRDTAFTTFAKERLGQLHLIPLEERPRGSMAIFMAKAWEELPYDEKSVYIKRSTDAVRVWEDALVKWRAALTEAEQDSAQADAELSPLLFRKVPSDPPETHWKLNTSLGFWGASVSRSTFRDQNVRAIRPTDISDRSDVTNGLLELFEHMMDGRDLAHPVGRVCSIYQHYDNNFFTSRDPFAVPPPRNEQLKKVWFLCEYKKIWFLVYQSPESLINIRFGVNKRF